MGIDELPAQGKVLKNGFTVVHANIWFEDGHWCGAVLARNTKGSELIGVNAVQWATWLWNDFNGTFSGHYFGTNEDEARKDYAERRY